jgi:hypothetical protein
LDGGALYRMIGADEIDLYFGRMMGLHPLHDQSFGDGVNTDYGARDM